MDSKRNLTMVDNKNCPLNMLTPVANSRLQIVNRGGAV